MKSTEECALGRSLYDYKLHLLLLRFKARHVIRRRGRVFEIGLCSSHVVLDLTAPSTAEYWKQGSPNDGVRGNRIRKRYIGKGISVHRDAEFVITAIPRDANCCTFMQESAYTVHRSNFGTDSFGVDSDDIRNTSRMNVN
jgi:hypothetical protein